MKRLIQACGILTLAIFVTAEEAHARGFGRGGGGGGGAARAGSYTGPRGTTVTGGSVGGVHTGPGGGVAVGGARAGTVTGPGGNTVAGASRGGVAVGPDGGVYAGGSRGAAAVGDRGGVAVGGSRAGVAVGPGGVAVGGSRARAATLPSDGGLARYSRSTVGGTRWSAAHISTANLHAHGVTVRQGFIHYNSFSKPWYVEHPGAWRAARLTAATVWTTATWAALSGYCSYPAEPVYYDYGTTVVYQGDDIYVDGSLAGTGEQYAEKAAAIAGTGKDAKPAEDTEWQPLGVFAMVQGEETTSNNIFQLTVNKQGVIRGNYYNAVSDTTEPVYGSIDKSTQRAAWTVGDKKKPVFEAGAANLTKDETTMMAHFGKDRSQQWTLVRVEQPKEPN